jgi:hypothetical protein
MSVLLAIRWAVSAVATTVPARHFFKIMIYNDINDFRYAMDCEKADKCGGSVGSPLLQAVLWLQTHGWRKQKSPPVREGREVKIGMA